MAPPVDLDKVHRRHGVPMVKILFYTSGIPILLDTVAYNGVATPVSNRSRNGRAGSHAEEKNHAAGLSVATLRELACRLPTPGYFAGYTSVLQLFTIQECGLASKSKFESLILQARPYVNFCRKSSGNFELFNVCQ